MTIRRLRIFAFVGFLLFVVAAVTVTFAALQQQRHDALLINLAGRQRMLIATIVLQTLGVQADADPSYRQQLRASEALFFEQTLFALMTGGHAPYDEYHAVPLPPPGDAEIIAQLAALHARWQEMDTAIHTVLAAAAGSAEMDAAAATVIDLAPGVQKQVDEIVRLYEAAAVRHVTQTQALQISFLILALLLMVTALVLTERWVIRPIGLLEAAVRRLGGGDLHTPVGVTGAGELQQLAHSFDQMRQNLAATQEDLAASVAQAQERLQRISALHAIDLAITSRLTLAEALAVLLQQVTERLDVDAAALALIDPVSGALNYAARRGAGDIDDHAARDFFPDGLLKRAEGVAGEVAHSGQPCFIPDVQADPRFVRKEVAAALGLHSYIAAPLPARGEILGVLEMATRQIHTFPDEEMAFFVTLAGQAAILIANTRMTEEALQRAAQQRALVEGAAAILTTQEEAALWPIAANAARASLTVDRVAVFLYDGAAGIHWADVVGLSPPFLEALRRNIRELHGGRLPIDAAALVIAEARSHPATAELSDLITQEGFHSMVIFPLLGAAGPQGGLFVFRDAETPFSPDDLAAGQTLTHILAAGLQNTRLLAATRRQLQELATLHAVAMAGIAAPDEDALIEQATQIIGEALYPDNFGVLLLDPDRNALRVHPSYRGISDAAKQRVIPLGQGISGSVAASGRARRVAVVADAVDYLDVNPETRAELCTPLQIGGRVIGVINAESTEPNAFSPADEQLLLTLSGQLASGIERLRAQRALQASEDRFRRLAENAPDLIYRYRLGPERGFEYVSPAATAITGYTPEEHYADPDLGFKIVHPQDQSQLQAYMQGGGIFAQTLSFRWIRKDGETIWTEQRNVPIYDEGGNLIAIEGIARDISERKRSEEELQLLQTITLAVAEAEDLHAALAVTLRLVCQATGWALGEAWTPTAKGDRLERSPAWYSAFPELAAFWQASADFTFAPGVGLPGRAWAGRRPVWARDVTLDPEFPRAHLARDAGLKAGMGIPVLAGATAAAVMDFFVFEPRAEDERLMAVVSAVAAQLGAVLQRKQAEAALRRRAAELEALAQVSAALRAAEHPAEMYPIVLQSTLHAMEAQAGLFFLFDESAAEMYVAASLGFALDLRLLRLRRGEGLTGRCTEMGQPVLSADIAADTRVLFPEAFQGFHKALCLPLFSAERLEGALLVCFTAAGAPTPVEISLLTAIAEMVANALRRLHLQEQTLRDAIALARERELNEFKSRFLSTISHEFRTPLTAILSSAEMLQRYGEGWPQERRLVHLGRIQSRVQRLAALLEDVLLISRAEAGRQIFHPRPLGLARFCRDLVEEFQLGMATQHEVTLDVTALPTGDPLTVAVDEQLLHHILDNLLSNAVKYSPAGSVVRLALRREEEEAVLQVSDQGIGIPAADLPRLFEPFYRAANVGAAPGAGLGMNIVKRAVEAHSGSISIASVQGRGTTVTVRLPVAQET